MNRRIIISFLTATVFLLASCQKDIDMFVPDAGQFNGPDTTWYNSLNTTMPVTELRNSLLGTTYRDSFNVSSGAPSYITTPDGLQCMFPPNCCVGNAGQVISGTVNVELQVINKKGDMIRMNKTTSSNNRLLVSAGELFIKLTKKDTLLQLAPNTTIQLRYTNTPVNTQMRLFLGDESNPDKFNWLPVTDTVNKLTFSTQAYEIITNHMRWINCDYFYDTAATSPRITLTADLASNFTNANTIVYTVFSDLRSVVGMYGDAATRKFSSFPLPVGKAVTVVVISKQVNDYYLGFANSITASPSSNNGIQHVTVSPVKKSLADIQAYLNSL